MIYLRIICTKVYLRTFEFAYQSGKIYINPEYIASINLPSKPRFSKRSVQSKIFLIFFGDQIAFQARYFQSDHICDEIYIMPFIESYTHFGRVRSVAKFHASGGNNARRETPDRVHNARASRRRIGASDAPVNLRAHIAQSPAPRFAASSAASPTHRHDPPGATHRSDG